MKVTTNYTINGIQDSYILEGDDIEEIREKNLKEMEKRGLDMEINDMYSEEL